MDRVKSIYGADIGVWNESPSMVGLSIKLDQDHNRVAVLLTVPAAEELIRHLQARVKATKKGWPIPPAVDTRNDGTNP